jgi:hypothetical protein
MRDLWCCASGETSIQLLSFTVAGLLTPKDRIGALECRDTYQRLEQEVRILRGFERRLAAEVSLQTWRGASAQP